MSIHSIKPKPVELEGLDKPRALLYDLEAFAYLEERFDPIPNVPVMAAEVVETTAEDGVTKVPTIVMKPTGEVQTLVGVEAAMHRLEAESFVALRAFIYAGLMHEVREAQGDLPGGRYKGETLTEAMVGAMLTPGMVAGYQTALEEALRLAMESGARPTPANPAATMEAMVTTTPTPDGTGTGSTTLEQSSSDEPTPNSGD